jgi:hypothetical protein
VSGGRVGGPRGGARPAAAGGEPGMGSKPAPFQGCMCDAANLALSPLPPPSIPRPDDGRGRAHPVHRRAARRAGSARRWRRRGRLGRLRRRRRGHAARGGGGVARPRGPPARRAAARRGPRHVRPRRRGRGGLLLLFRGRLRARDDQHRDRRWVDRVGSREGRWGPGVGRRAGRGSRVGISAGTHASVLGAAGPPPEA